MNLLLLQVEHVVSSHQYCMHIKWESAPRRKNSARPFAHQLESEPPGCCGDFFLLLSTRFFKRCFPCFQGAAFPRTLNILQKPRQELKNLQLVVANCTMFSFLLPHILDRNSDPFRHCHPQSRQNRPIQPQASDWPPSVSPAKSTLRFPVAAIGIHRHMDD